VECNRALQIPIASVNWAGGKAQDLKVNDKQYPIIAECKWTSLLPDLILKICYLWSLNPERFPFLNPPSCFSRMIFTILLLQTPSLFSGMMFCFKTPSFWALAMRNEVESHECTEFMVVPCLMALLCEVGMAVLFDQPTDYVMRIPLPCLMFKLYTYTTTCARYVWMTWLFYHTIVHAMFELSRCIVTTVHVDFPSSCAMICTNAFHFEWYTRIITTFCMNWLLPPCPFVQWFSCVVYAIIILSNLSTMS